VVTVGAGMIVAAGWGGTADPSRYGRYVTTDR